jgi:hypothetical protein
VPAVPGPHKIEFSIDGDPYSTTEKTLTARQLLSEFSKLDPASHYLIQVEGRHQESYADHPDDPIHLHPKQKFITAASGPTPVS